MSERNCSIEGCAKPVKARGWCSKHYGQWHKTGSPLKTRAPKKCSIKGCDQTARGRGWCLTHYRRWMRTGSPEGLTLERRFFEHIAHQDERGCWIWDKPHPESGYGQFARGKAHRWSYEFFVGEIPKGLDLDHLCRNRACVNPWHLDPVPLVVNVMRGEGPMAVNARKTHCIHGHAFTPENTYRPPKRPETRQCIACRRASESRRKSTSLNP